MPHPYSHLPVRLPLIASILLALSLPAGAQPMPDTAPTPPSHGLFLSAMDPSIKPCDDFYQYANGKWLAAAVISPEYADAGIDLEVYERNQAILHALAEKAAADMTASPNSPTGKVGSFYRSGMDEARIEADGVKPLAGEFARIDAIHDVPSLERELGHLHRMGILVAFNVGVGQDAKDSTQQIAEIGQGGLGLPEPGYYERTDKATQAIRAAYVAHIAKMLMLLGETSEQADSDAGTVLNLETRLARASMTPVERRDPHATYHKMTLAELNALTPGVDWQPYFTAVGLPHPGSFNVAQPKFFTALGQMMTATPMADWKNYLRWDLINTESSRLNSAFVDEDFHFYWTVLHGVPQKRPRWKRVLGATNGAVGEALGQLYVAQEFPPAAKARALALVQNLKAVLRDDLNTLTWMSPATKRQALVKLDAMRIKIGYPDKWRDYSKLDVTSPSYVVNAMRADEFEFQRDLNKIGKPVDRGEWGMTPPTVNAYYNPEMNDINFPAGILQPPFFDAQADDAVNYGAIGAVIGHEMTHAFDDQGRKFDAHGNLHNWWTAADVQNFNTRAQGIIAQYSAFEVQPGLHLKGTLTQGENIADIGGLKIAYLALEKSLAGKPHTKIDGFTPEQRFFLAFGQIWRSKMRPETERVRLTTDPHSPPRFRVLGPLADMPEFRQAFGCPPDPNASPTTIW
ncbi:MAG: M13 family metallopeptidase [Armatimonadota bacterium]|nr:M13 family metallopeptidase [Armatimonadota bacterium]